MVFRKPSCSSACKSSFQNRSSRFSRNQCSSLCKVLSTFLGELQNPANVFQFHALLQIKLQVSVMNYVVLGVLSCAVRGVKIQVVHQTPLVGRHPLFFQELFPRRQRKAVVLFVKFCRVFDIDLKYPSTFSVFFFVQDVLFRWKELPPLEISYWQWLAHCPSVEVVGVNIRDVFYGSLGS